MTIKHALICAAALALGACASTPKTDLIASWAAPDAGQLHMKKILVTAPSEEQSVRLNAELRMKQIIPGAVTSTSVFLNGEENNPELVRAIIREKGFDGVIIMRAIAVDTSTITVEPSVTTYNSIGYPGYAGRAGLYGYWGPSYTTVYDPGYTTERTVATIETELYAVDGEKLLWTSRSRTLNPGTVNAAIDSIIAANGKAMREQGLLPPK